MVGQTSDRRNRMLATLVGMSRRKGGSEGSLSVASGPRRHLYLALGGIFFVLACVGVVLPGIPTTPFLILTSYFLIRASPRLNEKLMSSRTFGPILRDWHEHRALRPRVKVISLVASSAAIVLSIFFARLPMAARIAVAVAGAYGIWFVWRLPLIDERR